MDNITEKLEALKESRVNQKTSLEAASKKLNQLLLTGKISKRGNNLASLNEQITENKHKYCL